mgnify:CR=1 FL=1
MLSVTIYGMPMAKPRMTRRDQFLTQKRSFRNEADAKRAEYLRRYFDWCNAARLQANLREKMVLTQATSLTLRVYLPMPTTWPMKQKTSKVGAPHLVKPDADNFLKGLCDALVENDQVIYEKHIVKRWDDGRGPRMEVTFS